MALEVVIEIRWVQTPYPLINTEKTAYWCLEKDLREKTIQLAMTVPMI